MIFKTRISSTAHECLAHIKDQKVLREVFKTFEALERSPDSQGKALPDVLDGYRSIHAWRDVYRIVYQIKNDEVIMIMVGKRHPGKKDDIYAAAQKLVKNLGKLR